MTPDTKGHPFKKKKKKKAIYHMILLIEETYDRQVHRQKADSWLPGAGSRE